MSDTPIFDAISSMSATDAAAYVLNAFVALPVPDPFSVGDLTVAITGLSIVTLSCGVLEVTVKITRGGESVGIDPSRLPLQYQNPPIDVPDGTFRTEMIDMGGETMEIQLPNQKEDLPSALIQMVSETVGGFVLQGVV
jgi:hypothetical protein